MMSRTEAPGPKSSPAPLRRPPKDWLGIPMAVWAAVVVAVVLAWLGQVLGARAGMSEQAAARNQRAAERLASGLRSATELDADLAIAAAAGQFASIRVAEPDGRSIAQADGEIAARDVPLWFKRFAPLAPLPGRALLTLDGRPVELKVELSLASTWADLWHSAFAAALAALGLGAAAVTIVALMRQQLARSLLRLDLQLRAIGQPQAPVADRLEADRLLHPIADTVARIADQRAALLAAHAEQMEALRRHAHVDAVTGLPNRRAFVAQIAQALGEDAGGGGVGLLLMRVRDLYGMNLRLGHQRVDEVLQTMADLMRAFPRQVPGCVLGRMNGSDFGLLLPVPGQAQASAQSLLAAVRPLLGPLDPSSGLAIGAAELRRPVTAGDALAVVDAALARAEIGGRFDLELAGEFENSGIGGESDWPQALRQALEEARVQLGARPLCTADGRLLLLESPMRMQIDPQGGFEPPARWLPLAARSRLVAEIDERAIEMALQAIEKDGTGRAVDVAGTSLATPGFVDRVSRLLAGSPSCAYRLCIDIAEAAAAEHPELVREASLRWRTKGTLLAIDHAGDLLARRPHLLDLGIDCVRIDARYTDGVGRTDSESARRYLRALVHLVQGVGLQITAERVQSAEDLEVLWSLGFDAATGSALACADKGVDLPLDIDTVSPGEVKAAQRLLTVA